VGVMAWLRHPRAARARRVPTRGLPCRPCRGHRRRQRRVPLRPDRSAALQRRAGHAAHRIRGGGAARSADVRARATRGQAIFVEPWAW
jgi:hypothetical protein